MSGTASFTKVLGIEEGIKCLPGVSFEQYRNLLFFSEVDNNKNNDFSCYNIQSRNLIMLKPLEEEECTSLQI